MENPTNRELKIMLDNQTQKFDEKHDDLMRVARETRDTVKEIVIQTTRTNGRVNKLEWWRSAFVWALGALWTLIVLLAPVVYIFLKNEIRATVNDALSMYEIEVRN